MKHVWKMLAAAVLLMALCLSVTGASAAGEVYGVCTGDNVRVRKQPSTGSDPWFYVDKGHVAEILGEVSGGWYKINTEHPEPNGRTYIGYISSAYFRIMTQAETDAYLNGTGSTGGTMQPSTDDALQSGTEYDGEAVVGASGKIKTNANFRPYPSTSIGDPICTIPAGTTVEITGLPEDPAAGWYRVVYNGETGYVYSTLVELVDAGAAATPDPGFGTETTGGKGVVTANNVRFRMGPGTGYDIICALAAGTEVELLTLPDSIGANYWYRVRYDGQVGYIQSNYIRVVDIGTTEPPSAEEDPGEEEEEEENQVVTNATGVITASGVNLREGPGTSYPTHGKLDKNTVVTLLSIPAKFDSSHWFKVRYDGQVGYVQAPFVRIKTISESDLPDEEIYGYARLIKDATVNLREAPGGTTVAKWTGKGTTMRVAGEKVMSSSYYWYPVYRASDSTIYYVREDMVEIVNVGEGGVQEPETETESPYGYVITTGSGVNLRRTAAGDVITQVPRNTILPCMGPVETPAGSAYSWYYVRYNGMYGYLRGDYVRVCTSTGGSIVDPPSSDPSDDPEETVTIYGYIKLNAGTNVYLREEPAGDALGKLPDGTILPIVKPVIPAGVYGKYGWYPVRTAAGEQGYIRADCAMLCDENGDEVEEITPPESSEPELVGATGKMTKNTNFRKGPSTADDIITVIKSGTTVEILVIPSEGATGWYKIAYNGEIGYVYGGNIEVLTTGEDPVTPPAAGSMGYVMITANEVNLRIAPGGTVLNKVDSGTVWPIAGDAQVVGDVIWFCINVDGDVGYVHSDYAFKLSAAQEDSYLAGNGVPDEDESLEAVNSNYLVITASKLHVRDSASQDGVSLGLAAKDTVLRYMGTKKVGTATWYNVLYDYQEGWVHGDYIRVMSMAEYQQWLAENPDAEPDVTEHLGYVRVTVSGLNVRNAANGSTVIDTIKKNTVVRYYLENISAGGYRWYMILTPDGEFGYVRSDMVTKCAQDGGELPLPEPDIGDLSSAPDSQQETSYTNLRLGSSGYRVTNLVNELINQGYYTGELTDEFTEDVELAVKVFQQTNGLYPDGIAGEATQHALFGTKPYGKGDTTNMDFTIYPAEKIDWFTGGIQEMIPRGSKFKIYDVRTGIVWWAYRQAGGKHADIETLSAADSARLCEIYGVDNLQQVVDENMWYPRRACLVTIGTRTFACSLDGMQHGTDTISGNGMDGQVCLHFTNSQGHSSGAVSESHAEAIDYAYNHCPAGKK